MVMSEAVYTEKFTKDLRNKDMPRDMAPVARLMSRGERRGMDGTAGISHLLELASPCHREWNILSHLDYILPSLFEYNLEQ